MKIETINEDKRGSICEITIDKNKFLMIRTNANYMRGGDFHDTIQYQYIILGRLELVYLKDNKEVKKIIKTGDVIKINPHTPHYFKSITYSVMIEYLEGEYSKHYYKPFRDVVISNL